MNWIKKGLIFNPEKFNKWMVKGATVPVPLHLEGDLFRIYFSTRNEWDQNQVGFIEINLKNPSEILKVSANPVLSLGPLGYFDCDGIYATSLVEDKGDLIFYYAGWNAGKNGLFFSSIGQAVSNDGGLSFKKYKDIPILSRNEYSKWAVMAPFTIKDESNFKMYFASGIKMYKDENGILKSYYNIKLATSKNGYKWTPKDNVCIDLDDDITNIARPCVIKEDGLYKCWFPFVSKSIGQYRIGYAESIDGLDFEIKSKNVIKIGDEGDFDSMAVTYPYVFIHNRERYMLYNGNYFGKTGFGIAKLTNK